MGFPVKFEWCSPKYRPVVDQGKSVANANGIVERGFAERCRGQVALALKQSGHPLDKKIAYGI